MQGRKRGTALVQLCSAGARRHGRPSRPRGPWQTMATPPPTTPSDLVVPPPPIPPLLVIDASSSYLELMKEKEVKSLVVQIQMTYSYLRKGGQGMRAMVTTAGVGTDVGDRLRIVACGSSWPLVELSERTLEEVWKTPEERQGLVYLTAESDRTLTEVLADGEGGVRPWREWPTLIVGGFVDKNRHPGRAHQRAVALGIPTARLPLRDYWDIKCKTVMAVNHLTQVMIRLAETGDWATAMTHAFPPRRGAKRKHADEEAPTTLAATASAPSSSPPQ